MEVAQDTNAKETEQIPEDLIEIFGSNPEFVPPPAFDLHSVLVPRWRHLLSNGSPNDEFAELLKKYEMPPNLPLLNPPNLNPELKGLVPRQNLSIESVHVYRQQILGKSLCALGKGLGIFLDDNNCVKLPSAVRQPLLTALLDSAKMQATLFYKISASRKTNILPFVQEKVRDLISNSSPSVDLFPSLPEVSKTVKNLELIGKDLAKQNPPPKKSSAPGSSGKPNPPERSVDNNGWNLNFRRPGRRPRETGRPHGQTSRYKSRFSTRRPSPPSRSQRTNRDHRQNPQRRK